MVQRASGCTWELDTAARVAMGVAWRGVHWRGALGIGAEVDARTMAEESMGVNARLRRTRPLSVLARLVGITVNPKLST